MKKKKCDENLDKRSLDISQSFGNSNFKLKNQSLRSLESNSFEY